MIAIDGPAGAGKSTVAHEVARRLGYRYLDTGAMYRAVVLAALDVGVDVADARAVAGLAGLATTMTADARLRTPLVEARVSTAAAHPEVREALRVAQRRFLAGGDAVAEGRDIGAVVWPDAELKVWLDAEAGERARRRSVQAGETPDATKRAIEERDRRDAANTLRAADAVAIDTTGLGADAVVERIVALARERGA